jgi:hypothetical protein
MADRADDLANHAEQRAFDPDLWGASPSWELAAQQSVYDDRDLDRELVPHARSLMPDETTDD